MCDGLTGSLNSGGMGAQPEVNFQQILAEAAQRRRRFDDLQKKLEEEERLKAQQALEDRRRARKEADERMRKPYRQPPPRHPGAVGGSPPRALRRVVAAAVTPQRQQQQQGRPQWGISAAMAAQEEERKLEEARQLRAARRDELRGYISMRRELMQGQGGEGQLSAWQSPPKGAAAPGPQQPPLCWGAVKQEAQLGFQELMLQAGLPVNVGLSRHGSSPTDRQQQRRAQITQQQQAQHDLLACCTDGMLQELGLFGAAGQPNGVQCLGPGAAASCSGSGQWGREGPADRGSRAWGWEEATAEPLPECRSTASPDLCDARGEGKEAEGGYSRRLLRLNSDLLASGEGLEGWERSGGGGTGAGKLPAATQPALPANSHPASRQEHPPAGCGPLGAQQAQQQPLQESQAQQQLQGGAQQAQQGWQAGATVEAPAEAATAAPAHQDSAAELAPCPWGAGGGSHSSGGFASLLGGSCGLGSLDQGDDDLPRYESDSDSLHDGSGRLAWAEESYLGAGSPASFATSTSSNTGAKLEGLEQQMQALLQLQKEVQQGLEGFNGGPGGGPGTTINDAAGSVGHQASSAMVAYATLAELSQGSAAATSDAAASGAPRQESAQVDAELEGRGAAREAAGTTVQQQARSFLQQAYALISRLRGSSSTQPQEASQQPQSVPPAQQQQQQQQQQPPPDSTETVVAPLPAGDGGQAQQTQPAAMALPLQQMQSQGGIPGGGEFLRRVSQELVQAGGHGELLCTLGSGERQAGHVEGWRLQHYHEALAPGPPSLPTCMQASGAEAQQPQPPFSPTKGRQPQVHSLQAGALPPPQQQQVQQNGFLFAQPLPAQEASASQAPMQQQALPSRVATQQPPAWPNQQWGSHAPYVQAAAAAVAPTPASSQQAQRLVMQPALPAAAAAAAAGTWPGWQPQALPAVQPPIWTLMPGPVAVEPQPVWQQQGQMMGTTTARTAAQPVIAEAAAPPQPPSGYASLAAARRKPQGGGPAAVDAKVEAPRKLEGSYAQAAKLAKERAAREEAERQQLQQQSQALKEAAKQRLKEQGKQGQQANTAAAASSYKKPTRLGEKARAAAAAGGGAGGGGTVLPGAPASGYAAPQSARPDPVASLPSVLSMHAWEPWRVPPQPSTMLPALAAAAVAPAAGETGLPLRHEAQVEPAPNLQQQPTLAGAVMMPAAPAVLAPTPSSSKLADTKANRQGQQQQQQQPASQQQKGGGSQAGGAAGAPTKGGGKLSRRAAQLLKLTSEAQMLSEHEGLVQSSLERLNVQLAAKGVASSDLDAPLSVAPRANSLMQLRLNKSLARLDGKLAGVSQQVQQAQAAPASRRPAPPAGKPSGTPSSSPSKSRHLKPAAAAALAAVVAQQSAGGVTLAAQQAQPLSRLPQLSPLKPPSLSGAAAAAAAPPSAPDVAVTQLSWAQLPGHPPTATRPAQAAPSSSPVKAFAAHLPTGMVQQGPAASTGAADYQQARPAFEQQQQQAGSSTSALQGAARAAAIAAPPPPRLLGPHRLQPLKLRAPETRAAPAARPPFGQQQQQGRIPGMAVPGVVQRPQARLLPPLRKSAAQPSRLAVPGIAAPPAWAGSAAPQQPWAMQPPLAAALPRPLWQQQQQPYYEYPPAYPPQLVPMYPPYGMAAAWGWQQAPHPGPYMPTQPGQPNMGGYAALQHYQ